MTGLRVDIVGAGPAGCLMAASLLQQARLRRMEVEIRLFGARTSWGADRPLVLDEGSIATLAALGLPLPSGKRLEGILTVHGARSACLPKGLIVLSRDRLVGLLRALLHAQGVGLSERWVSGVAALPQGGHVIRADGGSFPTDAAVLCCGAGAPLATTIAGHRPPPALRAFGLRFAQSLSSSHLLRQPLAEGDLWLLPLRTGAASLLVGEGANARTLGLRLLELGLKKPALAWGAPERAFSYWLPDGIADPGLPCLGNARGGLPGGASLRAIAEQADRLAGALLEEGPKEATALVRREARAEAPGLLAARWSARALRRFPPETRERALQPPPGRGGLPSPAQRALAGEKLGLWEFLLAFLLLLWIGLRRAFVKRRERPVPRRRSQPRSVFVVEDDPVQAQGLCAHLRAQGFGCRAFPDAMQAVQAANGEPPAALVFDLALPWVDGADALRALRRSWLGETPVLLTSALPQADALVRGGLAEAHFEKPLDPQGLVRTLEALLGSRGRPTPRERASPRRIADDT